MKTLLLTLTFLASTSAFAKAPSIQERIAYAANILASISEGSNEYTVKPNQDSKKMILELALHEGMVESEQEFNDSWSEDGSAWEADGATWGPEDANGARSYIEGALDQNLENSENSDADKIKFADGMTKTKQAFNILRSIKSVKFGVAPMGAVQCGVTFSSLLILDTENGKIHQIIMEGSGC